MSTPILRVGILGVPPTIQNTFLPTLASLETKFKLTIIYDSDEKAAQSAQKKFNIPSSTTSPDELLTNPEIDLVLNLLPFEYHEKYTIQALESSKHVMVETPLSLSRFSLRNIRLATEKGSTPTHTPKLFLGCARRYAPCYTDLFMKELASLDRIHYARCRNITGPLDIHAAPSTAPSLGPCAIHGRLRAKAEANGVTALPNTQLQEMLKDVFPVDDITPERVAFCRFLGTLGCQDLSLMRESLGFPDAVANVALMDPFYSAIFHYNDSKADGHSFMVMYEAGVDAVPRCDAHLTVYGGTKTVSVEYDFPCLGGETPSGFGVRVVVEEADGESGDGVVNGDGPVARRVKRTEAVSSVAEAYERELLAMHAYFVGDEGAHEARTTTCDAKSDSKLLHLIFDHYDRQCGTIRTPLG